MTFESSFCSFNRSGGIPLWPDLTASLITASSISIWVIRVASSGTVSWFSFSAGVISSDVAFPYFSASIIEVVISSFNFSISSSIC